jgi:hypothetical protein
VESVQSEGEFAMAAENEDAFLARLKRLKDSGAPWHEIARALRDRPEAADARVWKPLLAKASRTVDMSPVVLARYVSLLDRLHAIAPSPAEFESLVPPKFSSGEIAVRLFESDPVKGLQALKDLRTRKTTLEKLRAELSTQAVPRNRGRGRSLRDRAATVANAEKLLASEAIRLISFGASASLVRRPALRHMVREGFDILSRDGTMIAGLDLYLPEPPASGRDPLEPLARSILLSFYCRQFYLAFAPGFRQDDLRRAERVLDVFRAKWVGILEISGEGTVSMYRGAFFSPEPDRSDEYGDLVEGLRHQRLA